MYLDNTSEFPGSVITHSCVGDPVRGSITGSQND